MVVENLLNNAWKFTSRRPDASIEFGKTENNGSSAFFVKDDGAGFDSNYADRLFELFSGCTPLSIFQVPESGSPPCNASFVVTAAASGRKVP